MEEEYKSQNRVHSIMFRLKCFSSNIGDFTVLLNVGGTIACDRELSKFNHEDPVSLFHFSSVFPKLNQCEQLCFE
jgi:hypothetical protein